ncbi:SOS response-associated protein YedK [Cohnella sp. JJ-181]|nr:SOS response-associated protein YedK [Cohnella sp. JJ-181]
MAMFALDRVGHANLTPNYNVAPTQTVPAIIAEDGERVLAELRWGLIPFWAKDEKVGFKMINARAESVAAKPAYRNLIKRRRAVIPADGFYEWKKEKEGKQPFRFVLKSGEPFGFAGLWDEWRGPDGPVRSCTIITTTPNSLVADIHDRMPVMLPDEAVGRWLDQAVEDADELKGLLVPYDADRMRRYPVSREVGSVRNTGAELIQEVALNSK